MTHEIDKRINLALGLDHDLIDHTLSSVSEKIAAVLDLRDNPAVQVAGQYGQQQPSAALPQLNELLTQLALKQTQEALNKSTAVNDPMVAENERLRRQNENLDLQLQIQQKQFELQQLQAMQEQAAQGQAAQGQAMPGQAAQAQATQAQAMQGQAMPGAMGPADQQYDATQLGAQEIPEDFDMMEQLRQLVQAGPVGR